MKKVMLLIAGGIAALIFLIFAVGFMLPERTDARVSLTFASPPEKVWAAIADFEKHPMAGAQRRSTEKLPDEAGLPVWTEDLGASRVTIRTAAASAPTHVKRVMTDSIVPLTVTWEIHVEPTPAGGSRVSATGENIIRSGTWHVPIFRVIMRLGGAEKGLRDYWSSVAQTLGETPQFAQ